MGSPYLTKSDFKIAAECRTKLFYRKHGYPTTTEENEYLRFLADGGFMIEFIAKTKFPTGVELGDERDAVEATRKTADLLKQNEVVIFEAAVICGRYHVRVDILRKSGRIIDLIEVKSSSLAGDDEDDGKSPFLTKAGKVRSRWKEYIDDVAFQTHVLRAAFPEFEIRPHLCVVDKSQLARDSETLDLFSLTKNPVDPKARPIIGYSGDLNSLRSSKLVTTRSVAKEVALVLPEVMTKVECLAALFSADGSVRREQDNIIESYRNCRVCEFHVEGGAPSGFRECWGALAESPTHILDLHRVGQIGSTKFADPVPGLLKRSMCSYLELTRDELGAEGSFRDRRVLQYDSMRAGGIEHLPKALSAQLNVHRKEPGLPLHFVDFEACDLSLPHHADVKPYERIAFQWSCHTIDHGGNVSHREWLNTTREFPNFTFASTLRKCIGDTGTVYVWSAYEQTTLKKVLLQIGEWCYRNPERAVTLSGLSNRSELDELANWIEQLLGPEDASGKRSSPRIRDLHKLAVEHYFHPRMAGRTSIKVVLPAVWESDERLRNHPCFKSYNQLDRSGRPLDPYKVLPALPFGDSDDGDDAVREGTGAIRVYQDLIFAKDASHQDHENRQKLLFQYCKLDTAAMVMIWMHWIGCYDFAPAAA